MTHNTIEYIPPQIGLRADGSIDEGLGHLQRQLNLARILRDRLAWSPVFLTQTTETLRNLFSTSNEFFCYDVRTQNEAEICSSLHLELLLCDLKQKITRKQVQNIKKTGCKVWLYGNIGSGTAEADCNIFAFPEVANKLLKNYFEINKLKSADYAMIDERFRKIRRNRIVYNVIPQAKRIFVSMGGADEDFMTGLVVEALIHLKMRFHLDVVIGDFFKHEKRLEALLKDTNFAFRIHCAPKFFPDIAALADLAIVKFGNTVAELNCLGIPVVMINPSKFHNQVAKIYSQDGSAVNLGLVENYTSRGLATKLEQIILDQSLRINLHEKGTRKTDGRGVIRVADAMFRDFQNNFDLFRCDVCRSDDFLPLANINGRNLVKCEFCGLDYMNIRPTPQLLKKVYAEKYFTAERMQGSAADYEADKGNVIRFARNRLDTLEEIQPEKGKLLDIGCALGFYMEEARNRGWQVAGFDISEYAIRYAQKKLKLNNLRRGTVETLEYERDSFDAIICSLVLEHFLDPRASLEKILSWLRPGGHIAIKVPHAGGVLYRFELEKWFGVHPDNHFCDFTQKTLGRLLLETGAEPIKWQAEGIYLERFASAMKLSKNQQEELQAIDNIAEIYQKFAEKNLLGDSLVVFGRKFL